MFYKSCNVYSLKGTFLFFLHQLLNIATENIVNESLSGFWSRSGTVAGIIPSVELLGIEI